jgi:hypothetical protein
MYMWETRIGTNKHESTRIKKYERKKGRKHGIQIGIG